MQMGGFNQEKRPDLHGVCHHSGISPTSCLHLCSRLVVMNSAEQAVSGSAALVYCVSLPLDWASNSGDGH